MKGSLNLMSAAQGAVEGEPLTDVDAPEELEKAYVAVENIKRATLLVAGLGAMGYAQELEKEQEVMARVADMVAAAYLSESALLRAERLLGTPKGEHAARLAALYTFEAVDRVRGYATTALRRIPNGRPMLGKLNAYLSEHGEDLIGAPRAAAADAFEANGYPLA